MFPEILTRSHYLYIIGLLLNRPARSVFTYKAHTLVQRLLSDLYKYVALSLSSSQACGSLEVSRPVFVLIHPILSPWLSARFLILVRRPLVLEHHLIFFQRRPLHIP
jgi:hypothetical protein